MFTPSKEISHLVENTEFWGVKGSLISNMTASNINIPSVKTQQNPQFFGNRNNKNSKFHSDVIKNQKQFEANGFNYRKMKLQGSDASSNNERCLLEHTYGGDQK